MAKKKDIPWSLSPARKKVFALYAKRAPKYNPARVAGPNYPDRIVQTSAVAAFTSILGNIPYAICGGQAVALHGSPRMTQDIDLLVAPANLAAARLAMEKAGGQASNPLSIGGLAMKVNGIEVDLIALDTPWATDAIQTAKASPQGRVVAKPYLVLMKLWASRGYQEDADMMAMLKDMPANEWNQTLALVKKHLPNDVDDIKNLREYSTFGA